MVDGKGVNEESVSDVFARAKIGDEGSQDQVRRMAEDPGHPKQEEAKKVLDEQ